MTHQANDKTLSTIATVAIKRLSRFATGGASISRSFLFNDNRLSGVRFRAGLFYADWQYDDTTIKFFRDGRLIDELPATGALPEPTRRAA